MAELVGQFLVNLTYSEFPLLPPKLSANMTLLSGSADNLSDAS